MADQVLFDNFSDALIAAHRRMTLLVDTTVYEPKHLDGVGRCECCQRKPLDFCITQFRRDLETEHGLTNHPKAATVFGMAWDRGHSDSRDGYKTVAYYYEDLANLLKP